uniref:Uncharacterized protein n=1 Tax=Cafeteria roenbergensis TaxID=33653 RepID=A0A7S0PFB3_CAFRO
MAVLNGRADALSARAVGATLGQPGKRVRVSGVEVRGRDDAAAMEVGRPVALLEWGRWSTCSVLNSSTKSGMALDAVARRFAEAAKVVCGLEGTGGGGAGGDGEGGLAERCSGELAVATRMLAD